MSDDPQPNDRRSTFSAFSADLQRAAEGDAAARRRLWTDNYELFHDCAVQWFQRQWQAAGDERRISLCASDILGEVYLRLADRTRAMAHGRRFFFKAFYNECLRVAVDHYRKTRRHRAGRVDLESRFLRDEGLGNELDVLAETVDQLERHDARMGQIARMKVFDHRPDPERPGAVRGLTNAEIGEILGIATRTVEKDWQFAKAYLLQKLRA